MQGLSCSSLFSRLKDVQNRLILIRSAGISMPMPLRGMVHFCPKTLDLPVIQKLKTCATSPATDSRVTTSLIEGKTKQNQTCTLIAFLNFLQTLPFMAFLQRQSGHMSFPSERCHKASYLSHHISTLCL